MYSTPTLTTSKQQSRVQYTYFNGVNIRINCTAHLPKQCQYLYLSSVNTTDMYSTPTLVVAIPQSHVQYTYLSGVNTS